MKVKRPKGGEKGRDKAQAPILLDECNWPKLHWTRQRCRLVKMRWLEDDDHWETRIIAVCADHYRELRAETEPRHQSEGA